MCKGNTCRGWMFTLWVMLMTVPAVTKADGGLTLRDVTEGKFAPRAVAVPTPLNDGESYARLSEDGRRIAKYDFASGKETGVIFDADNVRGQLSGRVEGFIVAPDEKHLLLQTQTERIYRRSRRAVYYLYTIASREVVPLSKGGPQQEPLFSPDGTQVAFAREGNLFLVKLLFGNAESQVTTDGRVGEVLNGTPDWVNEEEFGLSRAFDFSADSKMLAWVRYDETKVPLWNLTLYRGMAPERTEYAEYPGAYSYKYPVAGAQNAKVSVHSFDIKSKVTRQMDLPLDENTYVPRIRFAEGEDAQLVVVVLNRHQNNMGIYLVNARSRVARCVIEEKDDRYVKETAYEELQLFGDHLVLMSDRSGTNQLYWYTLTGQLAATLTSGNAEVTKFYGYDARTGTFFYQVKDNSPLRTAVMSTTLKGKAQKLSVKAGANRVLAFSRNFRHFILEHSSLHEAPITSVCTLQGKTEMVLEKNEGLKERLAEAGMASKELFTFTTSDGIELNGWLMKPAQFDAGKKYPVIMYQYSGPGSQQVLDAWGVGFSGGGVLESYWTQRGFLVACVDGRGTGGRGADFEKCTYLHLGQLEARDQAEAARYLAGLSYVDGARIGIWGWSYGGFCTLMSMSQKNAPFRAGVAVAPPTSWKYYDSIYTERYMRTPGENPDGYGDDALARAALLNGRLLLCHGLADDNVHFQNVAEYSEALVQAGKQFDMQLYTNRNHSIYGGLTRQHLLQRITEFFERELK